VAIKEINLEGMSAQEAIEVTETFNREVHLLSKLNHPQIPHVYDHFSDQGHWYLVLEYIEGHTLETFLPTREAQGQPLRLEEILDLALQLCTVLEYLHQCQPAIIYRDLKPSNIMRPPQGPLVLIDFGMLSLAIQFSPTRRK
jgi:eukaryotic-like serine/threonine-protein kinase